METNTIGKQRATRKQNKTREQMTTLAATETEVPGAGSSTTTRPRSAHSRRRSRRKRRRSADANGTGTTARKRGRKPYPTVGFADVIPLAEAIMKHNAGQPTKRLTLLDKMGLEPGAQSTRNLITNSARYGLTEGHHSADEVKLTERGAVAVDPKANPPEQREARFVLAIKEIEEFSALYEKRKGNNMPAPEMLHDDLQHLDTGDRKPCADVFISNVRFLGMLVDRKGAQYLMTMEEWLHQPQDRLGIPPSASPAAPSESSAVVEGTTDYDRICFVISTINEPESEQRKHADVMLSQYIERALEGTGLKPVRADKIGDPGMISKQVIEHILFSKLVVADLSFHNPNVFYELSLRHVTGKPTVHLIQESDRIPFDIGNFRTIRVDTNDKYKMVSQLDTLRSEISTAIRQALANGESRDNPILTFCPSATFTINGRP